MKLKSIKGLQLQQALASTDGAAALITVDSHSPCSPAHATGRQMISQRTICRSHNLQASFSQAQNKTTVSVLEELPVSDQKAVAVSQLVTAGSIEDTEAIEQEAHQILLAAQAVDSHAALKNPEGTVCSGHVDQETKEQAVSLEMDTFRDFQASSTT